MKIKIKKSHIMIVWTATLISLLMTTLYIIGVIKTNTKAIKEINQKIAIIEDKQEKMKAELNIKRLSTLEALRPSKTFIFTNYGTWANDEDVMSTRNQLKGRPYNSGDFEINEDGMYTFEGKVVLAVGHSSVAPLKDGFTEYEPFEEIEFKLNGKHYIGIALDRCGVCTYGNSQEDYQRLDIYTVKDLGLRSEGIVYE